MPAPAPFPASNTPCPCGSGRGFGDCCEPPLSGRSAAATAEALMRSRYSAYVLLRGDYLHATWSPDTRPAQIETDIETGIETRDEMTWLGLKVKRVELGGPTDDTGLVEFVARFKTAGHGHRMHEISRFTRHRGDWVYLDGEQIPPTAPSKRKRGATRK